jgi:hypothetical protein
MYDKNKGSRIILHMTRLHQLGRTNDVGGTGVYPGCGAG